MLAELNLTKGRNLRCSALSPNGNLIACSDSGAVKLFRVSVEGELKKVQRLKIETTLTPSHRLVFSSDSKKLILATQDCLIQVFDLKHDRILKSFPQHQGLDETANDECL
jgi:WD40 repeat protein